MYLNTCSKRDLLDIDYIGEERAERILIARPFTSWNDLQAIDGVGENLINRIRRHSCGLNPPSTEVQSDETETGEAQREEAQSDETESGEAQREEAQSDESDTSSRRVIITPCAPGLVFDPIPEHIQAMSRGDPSKSYGPFNMMSPYNVTVTDGSNTFGAPLEMKTYSEDLVEIEEFVGNIIGKIIVRYPKFWMLQNITLDGWDILTNEKTKVSLYSLEKEAQLTGFWLGDKVVTASHIGAHFDCDEDLDLQKTTIKGMRGVYTYELKRLIEETRTAYQNRIYQVALKQPKGDDIYVKLWNYALENLEAFSERKQISGVFGIATYQKVDKNLVVTPSFIFNMEGNVSIPLQMIDYFPSRDAFILAPAPSFQHCPNDYIIIDAGREEEEVLTSFGYMNYGYPMIQGQITKGLYKSSKIGSVIELRSKSQHILCYLNNDSYKGLSGGPVFVNDGGALKLIGIHSHSLHAHTLGGNHQKYTSVCGNDLEVLLSGNILFDSYFLKALLQRVNLDESRIQKSELSAHPSKRRRKQE